MIYKEACIELLSAAISSVEKAMPCTTDQVWGYLMQQAINNLDTIVEQMKEEEYRWVEDDDVEEE